VLRRLWCVVVFCVLTAELPQNYEGHWSTPWRYIADALFAPIPILRLWWLDGIIIALLVAARFQPGATRGRARPAVAAITVSIGTLFLWALYGALRGGSMLDARLQLHVFVLTFVTAFTQMNLLRKPEHFRMLGATIVYAALFRFGMMFVFYLAVMRSLKERMEEVTDHGDSILFVTCIIIVVASALHRRKGLARAAFISLLMLWCMQINGRRLAWLGLVGSAATAYAMLGSSPIRRKVHRYALYSTPIIALYVAVGWSRPTGVFKPIASLRSVSDPTNPSTQSRLLEDMGLIVTLQTQPLLGTGFGHKYIEISDAFAVGKAFPQYRYVPHNSVLGLVAFTGAFGFSAIWMVFPVTAYLAARSYRFGRTPLEKTIAMCSVCEVLIHVNQMWGDIGISANQGIVIVSGAIAAASRLSVATGAWPQKAGTQKRQGKVVAVSATEAMPVDRTDEGTAGDAS
jgi:hypothetical protein